MIAFAKLTKRQIFRALLWLQWERGDMVYAGRLATIHRISEVEPEQWMVWNPVEFRA